MQPSEVKIGDLISTEHGLAQVMDFPAPALISCVILTTKYRPGTPGYKNYGQGVWIYLRGLDLKRSKIIK